MNGLNSQQKEAVLSCDTPLLVLAGAGSGKTRVIVEKIAYLIDSGKVPAKRIAAITFTNKAAKEMRERLQKRLRGASGEGLRLCTFHSLGLQFLQIEFQAAQLKRGFSIFDADDSALQIRDLMGGVKPDIIDLTKNLISQLKNTGLSPEEALFSAKTELEHNTAIIYQQYQARLTAFNALDFDDLIRLPVDILKNNADIRAGWQERMGYLLVDECQDTNDAQYQLLKLLSGERGRFTCVGDDDQSIYAWRGANPDNLLSMEKDYPNLKIIKLEQNYRCSNRILRAANTLIINNPHQYLKTLWSEQPDGERIRVWECKDSEHEAEKVAAEISFLNISKQIQWNNFCILFRGNHQSRPIEKALQLLRIPYHITGGTAFLDRQEVKDALAWLRLICNPDDDAAFLRAVQSPKREVGATTLEKLAQFAAQAHIPLSRAAESMHVLQHLSPRAANGLNEFTDTIHYLRDQAEKLPSAEVIRLLNEKSGLLAMLRNQSKDNASFERKRANLDELAEWFEGGQRDNYVGELAAQLALLSRADKDDGGNQVRLMSLHAAKGLEFEFVFIIGCEDGTLPHSISIEEGSLEEERRLLYVGITRAKQALWLSYSKKTQRFGEQIRLKPSRFLEELPADELQRDGADPVVDAEQKKQRGKASLAAIQALFGDK